MDDTQLDRATTGVVANTTIPPSRPTPSLADDVRAGLARRPRELQPKYFYDDLGSQLFDAICDTPEYYLTRTEDRLLRRHAAAIVERAGPHSVLELGSGTSRKTRHLLAAWNEPGGVYWPFDVSGETLERVAVELAARYPALRIHPLVGDYTAGFGNFPDLDGRTLALFLGSTLGNFTAAFAGEFLADFSTHLDPGDCFLLGADLDKDPRLIEAAYNDAQGLTARFNRNVLAVLNRELGADFDPRGFAHRAVYDRDARQIEMYLDSTRDQTVTIRGLDLTLSFSAGESILTEISRKFTVEQLEGLLAGARLDVVERWIDDERPYALLLAERRA